METNNDVLREIQGLKNDQKSGAVVIESEKQKFAKSLKNGLGEAMMMDLINPPKPSRWRRIKTRIRTIFKR